MYELHHMFKKSYKITGMGRLLLRGWNDQIGSTVPSWQRKKCCQLCYHKATEATGCVGLSFIPATNLRKDCQTDFTADFLSAFQKYFQTDFLADF